MRIAETGRRVLRDTAREAFPVPFFVRIKLDPGEQKIDMLVDYPDRKSRPEILRIAWAQGCSYDFDTHLCGRIVIGDFVRKRDVSLMY